MLMLMWMRMLMLMQPLTLMLMLVDLVDFPWHHSAARGCETHAVLPVRVRWSDHEHDHRPALTHAMAPRQRRLATIAPTAPTAVRAAVRALVGQARREVPWALPLPRWVSCFRHTAGDAALIIRAWPATGTRWRRRNPPAM